MPSTTINRISQGTVRYDWIITNTAGVVTSEGPSITPLSNEVFVKSRIWVRTPNFWALRRNRSILPDNAYAFSLTNVQEGEFFFRNQHTTPSGRVSWSLSVSKPQWALSPDTGYSFSNFDLYSRLAQRARRSNFSAPIAAIEGRKTVQMIVGTARTLARTIYELRRGDLTTALRLLGITPTRTQRRRFDNAYGTNPASAASNAWLQYRYGWKPLLNDAKNAAEALAELVSRNGDPSTASVSASSRAQFYRAWFDMTIGVSPFSKGNVRAVDTFSRRATWRFRPNAADLPGLFGLVNPLEVAWEIIPFSFVADWFLPIGSYLSALDLPLRFSHVGGSEGYRRITHWTTEPTLASFLVGNFTAASGGQTVTYQQVQVNRSVLSGPPVPSISSMTFNWDLNAVRATSAIALLWQQASRLRR